MLRTIAAICLILSSVVCAREKPSNEHKARFMMRSTNSTIEGALRKQLQVSYRFCQTGSESVNIARDAIIIVPATPEQDITGANVTFLLFTKLNPEYPYRLRVGNKTKIRQSTFDPEKLVVIFVDGYTTTVNRSVQALPQGILSVEDVNLIIVNRDSYNFFNGYYSGNNTIPGVARILGSFIQELISVGSNPKKFYLIGFSAGGEIVSLAAKLIKPRIARLLVLDPQGNCFNDLPPTQRVARTDADFVAVLHCSVGVFSLPPLPIYGHVTFYLNDAVYQPQCVTDPTPINRNTLYNINICSHGACVNAFFQSLINYDMFIGVRCNSTEQFRRHECDYKETLAFGFYVPHTARGQYYISTRPKCPTDGSDVCSTRSSWF